MDKQLEDDVNEVINKNIRNCNELLDYLNTEDAKKRFGGDDAKQLISALNLEEWKKLI